MIGMKMSSTREATILPKAAPMMTPTARSNALPLIGEFLEFLQHDALPLGCRKP